MSTADLAPEVLRRISLHEAAHVLVARQVGLGLESARLYPFAEVTLDHRRDGVIFRDAPLIQFYASGHMAEVIYDPASADDTGADHDFARLTHLSQRFSRDHVWALMTATASIIEANWEAVDTIADALLDREFLNAQALARILNQWDPTLRHCGKLLGRPVGGQA